MVQLKNTLQPNCLYILQFRVYSWEPQTFCLFTLFGSTELILLQFPSERAETRRGDAQLQRRTAAKTHSYRDA